jgi:hypothetical protein
VFQTIVLKGAFLSRGMARFEDVLSPSDADAIYAFLVDQAWTNFKQQSIAPRHTERDARSGARFAAKRPGIAPGPTFSASTQSQNALAAPEIDFSRGRNR